LKYGDKTVNKILYIPLDERPCNYYFPIHLSKETEFKLIVPPQRLLGLKKKPAEVNNLWIWIFENIPECSAAILSIDMLLYGGIVPSRLHSFSFNECKNNLNNISKIKKINNTIKLYAFNLIMRCPKYSSSDEEPDYYEKYGEAIFERKYFEHKVSLDIVSKDEIEKYNNIKIPKNILNDFEDRRNINRKVNIETLKFVANSVIDFLIIPQDDSAPYGYTALDQQLIRNKIRKLNIQSKALMYPGADEVGCTLLARCINESKDLKPKIKLQFSSSKAPYIIPLYEDRILIESIKYQVLAAGGLVTGSNDFDIELFVNAPGSDMQEASNQPATNKGYEIERNLIEFTEQISESINNHKHPVAIADVAYANGGDIELFEILKQKKLLFKLAGYAGWNTSSNTLGTVLSSSMICNIYKNRKSHLNFLALRYIEDIGYCSISRKDITDNVLPKYGHNYFKIDGVHGEISKIVKNRLQTFAANIDDDIKITSCYMPWNRMFEVSLEVKYK
jgi:hypothetical protein